MISIICPVFNEERYIEQCLESIISQDIDKNTIEVLFIDGMSTDRTRSIIQVYTEIYSFVRMIDNPNRTVPYALNIGIKESRGDILIRIDAHSYFPPNFVSTLVGYLIALNADNVGAVCITDVVNKNMKTLAIKEVLMSKFGVGNSLFRIGVKTVKEVDTVPFGCWRKSIFEKYGLFDTRLARNQDIEFNKRIIREGGKIYLVPDTYSIYYAREDFKQLAKNNFQNGKWNILTVRYTGQSNSLSLRHFIPLVFILSLMIPVVFSILNSKIIYISFLSITIYFSFLFMSSLIISLKKRLSILYLALSFITLHFSYGFGSLIGIIKSLSIKRSRPE